MSVDCCTQAYAILSRRVPDCVHRRIQSRNPVLSLAHPWVLHMLGCVVSVFVSKPVNHRCRTNSKSYPADILITGLSSSYCLTFPSPQLAARSRIEDLRWSDDMKLWPMHPSGGEISTPFSRSFRPSRCVPVVYGHSGRSVKF